MAKKPSPSAADRILDVAERLAQTRGFNGFSYADIAEALSVTKASLHYHFPSKADLGRELMVRYGVVFSRALDSIDGQSNTAADKLGRYVALYDAVVREDRMCLCGMFAAEYSTLPQGMQAEVRRFFDANEAWLAAVLEQGRKDGEFSFHEPSRERARLFLGALEGAMLVSRSYKDDRRFRMAAEQLLADLARYDGSARKPRAARRRSRERSQR